MERSKFRSLWSSVSRRNAHASHGKEPVLILFFNFTNSLVPSPSSSPPRWRACGGCKTGVTSHSTSYSRDGSKWATVPCPSRFENCWPNLWTSGCAPRHHWVQASATTCWQSLTRTSTENLFEKRYMNCPVRTLKECCSPHVAQSALRLPYFGVGPGRGNIAQSVRRG